jgi:hypothetical protein
VIGVGAPDFSMANCRVLNAGNGGVSDAISFAAAPDNISGTVTVSSTTVDGDFRDAIHIVKNAGSLNMVLNGCTLQNSHVANGRHGFHLEARGSALCNVTINNSSLINSVTQAGARILAEESGQPLLTLTGSTIQSCGVGVRVESDTVAATPAKAGFTITASTFTGLGGAGLDIQSRNNGLVDGTFGGTAGADGNRIQSNPADGVRLRATGSSRPVVAIRNNTISCTTGQAIDAVASNSSVVDITISNNGTLAGGTNATGVHVGSDTGGTVCANIIGNTATGNGGQAGIHVETNSSVLALERVVANPGPDPDVGDMVTRLQAENTATASASGGGFKTASDGQCSVPAN